MAWRLRYTFNVDWVAPGQGPIGSPQVGPGNANNQTLGLINASGAQNVAGTGSVTIGGTTYSNVLQAADITTLIGLAATPSGMAGDVSTQLNANLGRIQGFVAGLG